MTVIVATETTSVAQLKARLSHYLAKARAGQTIEVTAHRKPVARITGVPAQGVEGGLARLVAEGRLTPGDGQPLQLAPPVRLTPDAPSVSEIVLEDRGPRR